MSSLNHSTTGSDNTADETQPRIRGGTPAIFLAARRMTVWRPGWEIATKEGAKVQGQACVAETVASCRETERPVRSKTKSLCQTGVRCLFTQPSQSRLPLKRRSLCYNHNRSRELSVRRDQWNGRRLLRSDQHVGLVYENDQRSILILVILPGFQVYGSRPPQPMRRACLRTLVSQHAPQWLD